MSYFHTPTSRRFPFPLSLIADCAVSGILALHAGRNCRVRENASGPVFPKGIAGFFNPSMIYL
jgi:hypothetical protein